MYTITVIEYTDDECAFVVSKHHIVVDTVDDTSAEFIGALEDAVNHALTLTAHVEIHIDDDSGGREVNDIQTIRDYIKQVKGR